MIKFIREKNEYDKAEITMSIDDNADLESLLNSFDAFLKACGHVYNGEVTIFDDKEFFKDAEEFRCELIKDEKKD